LVDHASLIDLQLDAQNSYSFTYNIFIKILYMFRALPCSSIYIYIYTQLRRRPKDEQGNARNM